MRTKARIAKLKKIGYKRLWKNRLDIGVFCLLLILGIASRTPFVEYYNSHWDGAQFSMAVVSYDIAQDRPSPPGYPLYIFLGKIVHLFISDPHSSLLIVNVLVSALGLGVFYIIGSKMFNRSVGVLSAIFFFSGAVFYYFGITTYGYGLVPVFSSLFAYSVYRIVVEKKKEWLAAGVFFAIIFGTRPQEIVSIAPLLILAGLFLKRKGALKLYLISLIGTLIWLIPTIFDAGGVWNFYNINIIALRSGGLENTTDIRELARRIEQGIFLTIGLGVVSLLYYPVVGLRGKFKVSKDSKLKIIFFCVWFLPSFLFNIFVRSDHAGHQQVYLSSLVLLSAFALWKLSNNRKTILTCIILALVITNLWNFFRDRDPQNLKTYTQTSFHFTDLQKNDATYSEKITYIKSNFDNRKTILFATSPLWRVTAYYFPSYLLYNIVSLETKSERFRYIVRSEINWNSNEKTNKDFVFTIPRNIEYVVFFDTEYCSYNIFNLKKVYLPKNNCIGVLNVTSGTKYAYDYNSFKLMK